MKKIEYPDKGRLMFVLGVLLTAAFLVTSGLNYSVTQQAVKEEMLTSALPLTSDTIYSDIHTQIMPSLYVSSSMATDTFMRDWALSGENDEELIQKYLEKIREKYGFITAFFISAKTGRYYYNGGVLKTISREDPHDVWYYKFVASGAEHALDVDTNEAEDNILTVFMNYRVLDYDGKFLGVAGVGLKLESVASMLKTVQEKYKRTAFLVNHDGVVQIHVDPNLVENVNVKDYPGLQNHAEKLLNVQWGSRELEYTIHGERVYLSVRYIPEFDWLLFVQQSEKTAMTTARYNFIRTIAIGLIASLLILVLVGMVITRYQSGLVLVASRDPLTQLVNRRAFEAEFDAALKQTDIDGSSFSLILIDIDGLKQINDRLGHLDGDRVIVEVAKILSESSSEEDIAARWGGDEFLVLVNGPFDRAKKLAASLCTLVEKANLGGVSADGMDIRSTISLGLVEYAAGKDLDDLIAEADEAMYTAKESGGSCIR
ncbi:MAG: diguanylate cyclase domain-containing protein [Desulfovibrio sp.]